MVSLSESQNPPTNSLNRRSSMEIARTIPPPLAEHFESKEATVYTYMLLNGFDPEKPSGFQIVSEDVARTQFRKNSSEFDYSLPAQLRDAEQCGFFDSRLLLLATVRSAIPCADAIRGYVEQRPRKSDVAYGYINAHYWPFRPESDRLQKVIEQVEPSSIIVLDQYTMGPTIFRAAKLVQDAISRINVKDISLGAIPGNWYSNLNTLRLAELGLDGGDYVDYDAVSLKALENRMKHAGRIIARMAKLAPGTGEDTVRDLRAAILTYNKVED
jgi:hypothetical protein